MKRQEAITVVPGVAGPLRVRLRLEFHDEGAQAGVTCPRDGRAAVGWETATGPAPGHAQPGRSDRRLTPASRKGPGSAT
jgi:hypothetical protein